MNRRGWFEALLAGAAALVGIKAQARENGVPRRYVRDVARQIGAWSRPLTATYNPARVFWWPEGADNVVDNVVDKGIYRFGCEVPVVKEP